MTRLLPALAATLLAASVAWGAPQAIVASPTPQQIAAQVAPLVPNDYAGSYTLAGGLPDATANNGKRVLVAGVKDVPGFLAAALLLPA